jgi:hypothetical protein
MRRRDPRLRGEVIERQIILASELPDRWADALALHVDPLSHAPPLSYTVRTTKHECALVEGGTQGAPLIRLVDSDHHTTGDRSCATNQ